MVYISLRIILVFFTAHVFFDDAFKPHEIGSRDTTIVNEYVTTLIECVEKSERYFDFRYFSCHEMFPSVA